MIIDQKVYEDISRILVEMRNGVPLNEMATEKNLALTEIRGIGKTLAYHMFKIICLKPTQTTDYWKDEVINNYIGEINSLANVVTNRKTKKVNRLTKDELTTLMWEYPLGSTRDIKSMIDNPRFRNNYSEKQYPLITKHLDIMHTKMYDFYKPFLDMLHKEDMTGVVDLVKSLNTV